MKKQLCAVLLPIIFLMQLAVFPASAEEDFIRNILLAPCDGYVTISWQSNNCDNLARIAVYDANDRVVASSNGNPAEGVSVIGTGDNRLELTSDTRTCVVISGLSNSAEYSYRVTTTDMNRVTKDYMLDAVRPSENTAPDGWNSFTNGFGFTKTELSGDYSIAGNISMKILSNTDVDNAQTIMPELSEELVTGENYIFEFYAMAEGENAVLFGAQSLSRLNAAGSWEKYTSQFEYDGILPRFVVDGECAGLYIDWVTLRRADGGDNMIVNPNFEGSQQGEEEEDFNAAKNFFAVGRDRGLTVSWINPDSEDIRSITLWNENGDVIADSSDGTLSTDAGASNYIPVGGLSNGSNYKYTLGIEFYGGNSWYSECISNVLNDAGKMIWNMPQGVQPINGWTEGVYGNTYVKAEVTSKESYDGNASLLIRCNLPNARPNIFQDFSPNFAREPEQGKNYRFSYWRKGLNTDSYRVAYGDPGGAGPKIQEAVSESGWEQRSFDFTADGNAIRFRFERKAEELYIDNLELYELDNEGNPIGDNLIENGGLENGFNPTAPAEVSGAMGSVDMGRAELSWSSEPAGVSYIHIYLKRGNDISLRAIVNPGQGQVSLNGGISNEFVIRTVSASGVESEGVTVECTSAPLEVSEPIITIDSIQTDTLAPGSLNVTRSVKNNGMGDDFGAVMIVGIYDGNLLKEYKTLFRIIPEGQPAVEFSIDMELDEVNNGTAIKIFLWDSINTRNVVSEVIRIGQQEKL